LPSKAALRLAAAASLAALFILCLLWELWLAPLRPGGSFIALKALPLLLPMRKIFRGDRYAYQWSSMLILAYLAEGITRAVSEHGASQYFASLEVLLSAFFFAAAVAYARITRPSA
jgi:uncharacterized membrane protein